MKIPVTETMTQEEKLWQMKEALLKADEQCRPQTELYNKNGTPELMTVLKPNGSVSDIIKGDVGKVSGSIEKGSIVLHTHPMDSKVSRETDNWTYSSPALGPSGKDIQSAKDAQSTVLALDCASGTILGVDANGNAVEVYLDAEKKTATIQSLANEKRSQQLKLDDKSSINREYSQDIADRRLKQLEAEVSSQAQQKSSTSEILHSLANLLETGEDIAEVRQDMREKRAERRTKEQAEQERKAAEEAERLRQQQQAERHETLPQKKDAKKSDKKPDEKKDSPKKDTPKKSPSQPVQSTTGIDFSKLNGLVSSQASLVRSILSSGQKATAAQRSQFNSLNNQYVSEFNRLKTQIGNISDPSKRSQYYSQLAAINSRISSEVDPLLAQGQRQGLFTNL